MTPNAPESAAPDVPEGFRPLFRSSPFLDANGPFFHRPLEQGFLVGLRVMARHTNAKGSLHGGLIATLADVSMGYVTGLSQTPALRMVTSSLAVDYVGTARVGDWVESAVTVVKAGGRLAFVNALITAREAGAARPVASARAVFLVLPPPAAA
jgi:uncharacterized protein (TIGR00369 family)